MRRNELNISQKCLADHLGITFQQIQKYENGKNRVSASRLFEISKILGVSVSYFFGNELNRHSDWLEAPKKQQVLDDAIVGFLSSQEGFNLNKAFYRVESPALRKRILSLVRSISRAY